MVDVSLILMILAGILLVVTMIVIFVFGVSEPEPEPFSPSPEPGPSPGPNPQPGPNPSPEPGPPPKEDSYLCYYKSNSNNYIYLRKQSSANCDSVNDFTLVDTFKIYNQKKDDKMLKYCVYDASKTTGTSNNTYIISANYFNPKSEKCEVSLETAPLVSEFYSYGSRSFESKAPNKNQKTYCIYNYRDRFLKNVMLEKTTDVCSLLDRYNSQSEISFIK